MVLKNVTLLDFFQICAEMYRRTLFGIHRRTGFGGTLTSKLKNVGWKNVHQAQSSKSFKGGVLTDCLVSTRCICRSSTKRASPICGGSGAEGCITGPIFSSSTSKRYNRLIRYSGRFSSISSMRAARSANNSASEEGACPISSSKGSLMSADVRCKVVSVIR